MTFFFLFPLCSLSQQLLKQQQHVGLEAEEQVQMKMMQAEESYRELLHSAETNMQVSGLLW